MSREQPNQVRRATLAEQVEDAIRVDIVMGVLKPGQRLRAVEMALRYGVSATPIREGLQRLAGDGLVDIDPRLGAAVAVMSREDLRDIYDARLILETQALFRSVQRLNAAGAADLDRRMQMLHDATVASRDAGFDRELDRRWSTAHREFHHGLVQYCDSAWLMRFVTTLYDHAERYRMLTRQMIEPERDTLVEHREIYEAAIRGDGVGAVSLLRQHLRLAMDALPEEAESIHPAEFAQAPEGEASDMTTSDSPSVDTI